MIVTATNPDADPQLRRNSLGLPELVFQGVTHIAPAANMMFAGARAYVGTLFPVLPFEAADVVTKLLENHWGKPLPIALWAAQRDVYGAGLRRPYVVTGVFPQRLHIDRYDYPVRILKKVGDTLAGYKEMLAGVDPEDLDRLKAIKEIVKIHQDEWDHFSRRLDRD